MRVTLSFDVEVWCGSWEDLDQRFPMAFDRYVYGRSARGEYALPQTLEILARNRLRGVFFVEPLFAARFGRQHLKTIVDLIQDAGQEVQLHLHPEWTDEISPAILADVASKRQHLTYYSLDEQAQLIRFGLESLNELCAQPVDAFRAGSYAANQDTFKALSRNGIFIDSSLNSVAGVSGADLTWPRDHRSSFYVGDVISYPVTVFRDGFGRDRPAQLSACSFHELRDALLSAHRAGCAHFVIVSHNFELLKSGSAEPDMIVVRRFERLCEFLADHPDLFQVEGYGSPDRSRLDQGGLPQPRVGVTSTARRYAEQLARRWW
jgi:hypothetical protein